MRATELLLSLWWRRTERSMLVDDDDCAASETAELRSIALALRRELEEVREFAQQERGQSDLAATQAQAKVLELALSREASEKDVAAQRRSLEEARDREHSERAAEKGAQAAEVARLRAVLVQRELENAQLKKQLEDAAATCCVEVAAPPAATDRSDSRKHRAWSQLKAKYNLLVDFQTRRVRRRQWAGDEHSDAAFVCGIVDDRCSALLRL